MRGLRGNTKVRLRRTHKESTKATKKIIFGSFLLSAAPKNREVKGHNAPGGAVFLARC